MCMLYCETFRGASYVVFLKFKSLSPLFLRNCFKIGLGKEDVRGLHVYTNILEGDVVEEGKENWICSRRVCHCCKETGQHEGKTARVFCDGNERQTTVFA